MSETLTPTLLRYKEDKPLYTLHPSLPSHRRKRQEGLKLGCAKACGGPGDLSSVCVTCHQGEGTPSFLWILKVVRGPWRDTDPPHRGAPEP